MNKLCKFRLLDLNTIKSGSRYLVTMRDIWSGGGVEWKRVSLFQIYLIEPGKVIIVFSLLFEAFVCWWCCCCFNWDDNLSRFCVTAISSVDAEFLKRGNRSEGTLG